MALALATVGLIGGVMTAVGQAQEGEATAQAYEYNAAVAREEINISRAKRNLERAREKKQVSTLVSEQEALFAKAGVALSGSPLLIMQETAENAELDILINDINASIEESKLQSEITQEEYSAQEARRAGRTRAAATLLSTVGSFGSKLFAPGEKSEDSSGSEE